MNKILYITNSFPPYFYRFASMPIADQVNDYIKDRSRFIRNLNNIDNFYIRMYHNDYGRNEEQILTKEFPNLLFDIEKKINYKRYDLIILDHPITSLLEAFIVNVPVIMFWDETIWKVNKKFKKYLLEFQENNIHHANPRWAAYWINRIKDSKEWWRTRDQNLINNFKREFTSTKRQMINKILEEIKN